MQFDQGGASVRSSSLPPNAWRCDFDESINGIINERNFNATGDSDHTIWKHENKGGASLNQECDYSGSTYEMEASESARSSHSSSFAQETERQRRRRGCCSEPVRRQPTSMEAAAAEVARFFEDSENEDDEESDDENLDRFDSRPTSPVMRRGSDGVPMRRGSDGLPRRRGSDGIMRRGSDGIMMRRGSGGMMRRGSDGMMRRGSDGIMRRGSDGIMMRRGSGGMMRRGSDGIMRRGSDGIMMRRENDTGFNMRHQSGTAMEMAAAEARSIEDSNIDGGFGNPSGRSRDRRFSDPCAAVSGLSLHEYHRGIATLSIAAQSPSFLEPSFDPASSSSMAVAAAAATANYISQSAQTLERGNVRNRMKRRAAFAVSSLETEAAASLAERTQMMTMSRDSYHDRYERRGSRRKSRSSSAIMRLSIPEAAPLRDASFTSSLDTDPSEVEFAIAAAASSFLGSNSGSSTSSGMSAGSRKVPRTQRCSFNAQSSALGLQNQMQDRGFYSLPDRHAISATIRSMDHSPLQSPRMSPSVSRVHPEESQTGFQLAAESAAAAAFVQRHSDISAAAAAAARGFASADNDPKYDYSQMVPPSVPAAAMSPHAAATDYSENFMMDRVNRNYSSLEHSQGDTNTHPSLFPLWSNAGEVQGDSVYQGDVPFARHSDTDQDQNDNISDGSYDGKCSDCFAFIPNTHAERQASRAIHKAAETNSPLMKSLLANSSVSARMLLDMSPAAPTGDVPAHISAKKGKLEALNIIIGFDKDSALIRNEEGRVALHEAVDNGHFGIVQALCMRVQASARIQCEEGNLPLHNAVSSAAHHQDAPQITAVVLGTFPEAVKITTDEGLLPLHLAAMSGFPAGIRTIFAHNFDTIYEEDVTEGMAPLDFAVDGHRLDVMGDDADEMDGDTTSNTTHLSDNSFHDDTQQELAVIVPQQTSQKKSSHPGGSNNFEACIDILLMSIYFKKPVLTPRDETDESVRFLPLHATVTARPLNRTWKYLFELYGDKHHADIDDMGRTALHHLMLTSAAAEDDETTIDMIKNLHEINSSAASQQDNDGFLPLHLALVASLNYDVVHGILDCNKCAVTVEVAYSPYTMVYQNMLPFAIACCSGCDVNTIYSLLRGYPAAVMDGIF